MQPPFHFTGDPKADWIILAIGAFLVVYWLRALRLAREGARLFLRNVLKAVVVVSFSMCVLISMRSKTHLAPVDLPGSSPKELAIAGFVALIFFNHWQNQKRSRYIPKSVKRAVIERDLEGEEYDSSKHHIDHVWPFSKGGSHTPDNLRVIAKKKNLQKGAKRPRMKDMW
jgi:hypothetical protein